MKTPSERGVTGAWAYQARQELGLSVEQVADAMALRGQAVSPATIRGIESGAKKPGARLLRVLAQVLESSAPGVASPSELSLEERAVLAAERSAVAAEALLEATQQQNALLRTLLLRAMTPDEELRAALLPLVGDFEAATPTPYTHQSNGPQTAPVR